jgi:hypothetical protein
MFPERLHRQRSDISALDSIDGSSQGSRLVLRLEQQRGQVRQVLSPERPGVCRFRDLCIRDLDVPAIERLLELGVEPHKPVRRAACDPAELMDEATREAYFLACQSSDKWFGGDGRVGYLRAK